MFKILLGLFFSFFLSGSHLIKTKTKAPKIETVKFIIKNKIKRMVSVAVNFKPYNRKTDTGEDWQKKAWYYLKPGQSITLETNYAYFYFYAESIPDFFDKKLYWMGDKYFEIGGKNYGFREIHVDADYRETLTYDDNEECYLYPLDLIRH
jgi:hypothetical protein